MTVDDADDLRALVRTVLESNGFDVVEAASGRAALDELAAGTRPDVIVLDVQMPDLDGWDTLAAIRGEPATADLAVVLCTVRAAQADMEHGWQLGCDGFLPKPFAIEELARIVMETCGRSQEERAALRAEHQTV
jgi:CheY-like chemotaxis protein